jgi:hypothetical protein
MTKVLLVASGMSAKQIDEYDYKSNGWKIVAVNNGWLACEDIWDFWIRSNDFKGSTPTNLKPKQAIVKSYGPSLMLFGGQKACGYSITLNAGYWVLANLKPTLIGLLGADMNYTPDDKGHTHIYGTGNDIIKNGIPDPDRMANMYGAGNKDYLSDIYLRLEEKAKENNCDVVNVSHTVETRLPYKRIKPDIL